MKTNPHIEDLMQAGGRVAWLLKGDYVWLVLAIFIVFSIAKPVMRAMASAPECVATKPLSR